MSATICPWKNRQKSPRIALHGVRKLIVLLRKKILVLAALLLFGVLLLCGTFVRGALPVFRPSGVPERSVIVIDAGHGGEDGGAVAADGTETTLLDDGESDTLPAALVPDGETLRVYAVPKGQENADSVWYDLSERSPRVES